MVKRISSRLIAPFVFANNVTTRSLSRIAYNRPLNVIFARLTEMARCKRNRRFPRKRSLESKQFTPFLRFIFARRINFDPQFFDSFSTHCVSSSSRSFSISILELDCSTRRWHVANSISSKTEPRTKTVHSRSFLPIIHVHAWYHFLPVFVPQFSTHCVSFTVREFLDFYLRAPLLVEFGIYEWSTSGI